MNYKALLSSVWSCIKPIFPDESWARKILLSCWIQKGFWWIMLFCRNMIWCDSQWNKVTLDAILIKCSWENCYKTLQHFNITYILKPKPCTQTHFLLTLYPDLFTNLSLGNFSLGKGVCVYFCMLFIALARSRQEINNLSTSSHGFHILQHLCAPSMQKLGISLSRALLKLAFLNIISEWQILS